MKQVAGTIKMDRTAAKEPNKWVKLAEMFREIRSGNVDRAMEVWKEIAE